MLEKIFLIYVCSLVILGFLGSMIYAVMLFRGNKKCLDYLNASWKSTELFLDRMPWAMKAIFSVCIFFPISQGMMIGVLLLFFVSFSSADY